MGHCKCHCTQLLPCLTHESKHAKKRDKRLKLRQHAYFVQDSIYNIPGYKYDYIRPALTTQAGGIHFQ